MGVIINEFEIVPAAEAPPRTADRPAAPPRDHAPTPQDLERVARRLYDRRERVRAD